MNLSVTPIGRFADMASLVERVEDLEEGCVPLEVVQDMVKKLRSEFDGKIRGFLKEREEKGQEMEVKCLEKLKEMEDTWKKEKNELVLSIKQKTEALRDQIERNIGEKCNERVEDAVRDWERRTPKAVETLLMRGHLRFHPQEDGEEIPSRQGEQQEDDDDHDSSIEMVEEPGPSTAVTPQASTSTVRELSTGQVSRKKQRISLLKMRVDWSSYTDSLQFLVEACKRHNYSRKRVVMDSIFQEGVRKGMWPNEDMWERRVVHRIEREYKLNKCLSDCE